MTKDWVDDARRRLLDLRRGPGAWGYHARSSPAVEPSAMASLALLATDREDHEAEDAALASARWLASIARPDGSLGVSNDLVEPAWPTPYAMLLWETLGGFEAERSAALDWLIAMKGGTSPRIPRDPMGHDTTLVGWPWVAGTHSWVEPSALAILALAREGKGSHSRIVEGTRLLIDRAVPGGGWNLGNPVVFGTTLRPVPGPSGLALLALARVGGDATPTLTPLPWNQTVSGGDRGLAPSPLAGEGRGGGSVAGLSAPGSAVSNDTGRANPPPTLTLPRKGGGDQKDFNPDKRANSKVVEPALAYLRKALAETLAPISLGWGWLGLRAWQSEPAEGADWLRDSFKAASNREPRTVELALLLLAAGPRSLERLGFPGRSEATRHA